MYKVIDLEQGSPEWLEFRKGKIGGSAAPAIMGVSPWKTPYKLYNELISGDEKTFVSPAMRRGNELEPMIRDQVNKELGMNFEPKVIQSASLPWMYISLDGMVGVTFLEIKTTSVIEDHEGARKGIVPKKYYPQLQHAFLVGGFEKGYYASYCNDDLVIIEVPRDEKYIKKLRDEEIAFYEKVINFDPPENPDGKDVSSDNNWEKLEQDYIIIDREIAEIKKKLKILEASKKKFIEAFKELSNNESAFGNRVKLRVGSRKSGYDLDNIPQLKGVDLEPYTKYSQTSTLTVMGE